MSNFCYFWFLKVASNPFTCFLFFFSFSFITITFDLKLISIYIATPSSTTFSVHQQSRDLYFAFGQIYPLASRKCEIRYFVFLTLFSASRFYFQVWIFMISSDLGIPVDHFFFFSDRFWSLHITLLFMIKRRICLSSSQ